MASAAVVARVEFLHVLQEFLDRRHCALMAQHDVLAAERFFLVVVNKLEDYCRARGAWQFV